MRAYHFINRLVELLSRRTRVLILTPYVRNIGNCAEELYWGLLKARREDKKALFLFPRPLFWKFRIDLANRELYEIESDFSLRNSNIWCRLAGYILTVIFAISGRIYLRSRQFLQAFRPLWPRLSLAPYNNIFYVVPSIGHPSLWKPEGVDHFSFEAVAACKWKEQLEEYLPVRLERRRRQRAERTRVEMGIPADAWYVCLHVREGGYRDDAAVSGSRYVSICNYAAAIKAVTNAGGFVVRLGDPTMTRLPPMERFIDYPHSTFKSALMDLYLISHCHMYLGVNSGPLDIAWLFQKRVILTNLCEWLFSFSRRRGDLAIIKHVYSRSRQRFLSLKELLLEPYACQFIRGVGDDYVMVENTPEEIRDVVVEALNTSQEYELSKIQEEFNEGRNAQIRRWLEDESLVLSSVSQDDIVQRYRFASRWDSYAGAIGKQYSEENWWQDSTCRFPESPAGSTSCEAFIGNQA